MLPVTIAIIAYESLSATEEAKHGRVVDRDAGQGERHALKESCDRFLPVDGEDAVQSVFVAIPCLEPSLYCIQGMANNHTGSSCNPSCDEIIHAETFGGLHLPLGAALRAPRQ